MKHLLTLAMLLAAWTAHAQFTLKVNIQLVKSKDGLITIGLYNASSGYLVDSKQYKQIKVKPKVGETIVAFTDLPVGNYAVTLYHDINGDKVFNRNFVGYPTEPFGFSRISNFPLLRKPSFNETSIRLAKNEEINVVLGN